MKWIYGRHGWVVPLTVFAMVLGVTVFLDQKTARELESAKRDAAAQAERRAGVLADEIGNAVSARIGALAAPKLQFTPLEDSVSSRTMTAALDSVTNNLTGLTAITVYHASGRVERGLNAGIGRPPYTVGEDTALSNAYARALATRRTAATGVMDLPVGRRVVLFEPVVRGDSSNVLGMLAAELEPSVIFRIAQQTAAVDSIPGQASYTLFGPNRVRITSVPTLSEWPVVDRPIRVADTEWTLGVSYPPISERLFKVQRIATWVTGLALAFALAGALFLLRRTIATQREEIARRKAAEEEARRSAAEARERAQEARELAAQLSAAQSAAERLSTSLDPDAVVELFLGGVGEILGADVASLYTFEEEGEVLVGRKRMVLRHSGPATERLQQEDIRNVRAPVAMLPVLKETVATGEPHVVDADSGEAGLLPSLAAGPESASASATLPLLVGGHMVGVASWEVYSGPRRFDRGMIAFARALAAPAAAALRTAELFSSLEAARTRAQQEASRFGTVLDRMADGVVVVDAKGRIERFNNAAEELLGPEIAAMGLEEWMGRFRVATPDGRPYSPADFPLVRALRGERVRRTNFVVRSTWGADRYLSCSAGPILGAGSEPQGAAMVFRDVTDEHQYAEMLRHTNRELRQQADVLEEVNRQLMEATRAKDQFLAVMSHELRTPINAIMGYSDLLDLEVKGTLNDDQKSMVGRIRDTSRHLLGLINEVLDLAKVGAGRVDLVLVEVEAASVVDRAVQQIMPLAAAKGLHLQVEKGRTAQGAPMTVLADETRLAQIVINLLSNAVKFTPQGEVRVSTRAEGDRVQIRVRDTGPGISAEQRERIFEEFYQVESGFARSSGGTGLGLTIARRFARLMGGDLWVESEPGEGAEFIVELPSAEAAAPQESTGPSVVMLTQDEEMARRASSGLEGAVRLVRTGEAARVGALARREAPRVVALDVRVPDFGAWRALSLLLAEDATADVPVVLVAGDAADGGSVLNLGEFVPVPKPLALEPTRDRIAMAAHAGDGSVLVVDDDADSRRILAEALTAEGCRVTTAADGAKGLRLLDEVRPAAVVLDLLMPGMEGTTFLARLRERPELRDVPAFVLTARELSPDEMERLQASVDTLGRQATSGGVSVTRLLLHACGDTGGAAEETFARAS